MGSPTKDGESPVDEAKRSEQYPEYMWAREIRMEVGGTTLQA